MTHVHSLSKKKGIDVIVHFVWPSKNIRVSVDHNNVADYSTPNEYMAKMCRGLPMYGLYDETYFGPLSTDGIEVSVPDMNIFYKEVHKDFRIELQHFVDAQLSSPHIVNVVERH